MNRKETLGLVLVAVLVVGIAGVIASRNSSPDITASDYPIASYCLNDAGRVISTPNTWVETLLPGSQNLAVTITVGAPKEYDGTVVTLHGTPVRFTLSLNGQLATGGATAHLRRGSYDLYLQPPHHATNFPPGGGLVVQDADRHDRPSPLPSPATCHA